MMSKPWWQSKTIWVNLVTLMIALLGAALGSDLVKASPDAVWMVGGALSGANIILRFLTGRPITGVQR